MQYNFTEANIRIMICENMQSDYTYKLDLLCTTFIIETFCKQRQENVCQYGDKCHMNVHHVNMQNFQKFREQML